MPLPPKRVVFDHIQKTAGTSLKEGMAAVLGESGCLPDTSYPHRTAMDLVGERNFLASHLWFYPGESLAEGWWYTSVLRDPIDRFLSHYYYYRGQQDDVYAGKVSDPQVIAAVDMDIEQFVFSDRVDASRMYANMQAMHFAWRVCDSPEQLSEAALLDAAKCACEDYGLIGVYESLDDYWRRFCQILQVQYIPLAQRNVTGRRADDRQLSTRVSKRLRSANAVDTAFHAWCRERFVAQSNVAVHPLQDEARTESPKVGTQHPVDFGSKAIRLLECRAMGKYWRQPTVRQGEPLLVQALCEARCSEPSLTTGIAIFDEHGQNVFGSNSNIEQSQLRARAHEQFLIDIEVDAPLPPGDYRVTLALHKGNSHLDGCYHWRDEASRFHVDGGTIARPHNDARCRFLQRPAGNRM